MRHRSFLSCLAALCIALAACAPTESGVTPVTNRAQTLAGTERDAVADAQAKYDKAISLFKTDPRCISAAGGHPHLDGCLIERGPMAEAAAQAFVRVSRVAPSIRPGTDISRFRVALLNDMEVNAIALAGGKIFVFRGIVEKPALTHDELAAIVAHEMAHALAQHQREAQAQREQGAVMGAAFGVALAALTGVYADLSGPLFVLPHSREQESEADLIALKLLARAGYDPRALPRALEKIAAHAPAQGGWLSTHPAITERVSAARGAIERDPELARAAR